MPNSTSAIEAPGEHAEPATVTLHHRALQRVNFASAQNDVAIIEEIAVENPTDAPLSDVRITLRASPPIIREKTWIIDRIAPESQHVLRDLSTPLDIERLRGLDEAEVGELEFCMEAQGLRAIVEKRRIELLARDEWGGVGDMAQLLAAFVSPNDPAVARVLKEAARLLERAGHAGSMNGYQSGDPRRAYMLAGAIWSAVTGLALTYAEPPASFERAGQKIRGPDRLTREGLATCLDSTLFLAAAFEAAGLNPVVLFSQGHAWVGVWIVKKDFGNVTEPDVVAVRKAAQASEFVSIETGLLTKRPAISFDQAEDEGRRRLAEHRDPEFVMAVDIARSRAAHIRPLASHKNEDHRKSGVIEEVAPASLPPIPDFGLLLGEIGEEEPETPQDRIERWQRKLLDLSLRNRLLNYRDSKQTLPLRCPDAATLEDELAEGKKFQGFSLQDNNPIRDRTVSPGDAQRIEEKVIRNAFEHAQVVVPLTGQEMNKRFLTLYRRARSDMQEGGTNTLFLAVGFLRWKKAEGDTHSYRAPLLLIPVKLERRSAQSPFHIAHHEDDARINSTLLEFLKRDFTLRVPELEGELPRDHGGIDVPRIFGIMRQKVRDVSGFEVVEELAISTFSFAKYLMWKDLVDRSEQLRQNRLVKHLIDGAAETYGDTGDGSSIAPREIDRQFAPRDLLTPLSADSSQLAAVLAARDGRDFVLVGPPGTGKSQTITNIIAQCLGEGRTVLFVAEKAAALDVVHRRLVRTGLGDVVLELHSNKMDRKSVLEQLGRGWDRASGGSEEKWIDVTESLRLSRDQLNAYVEALHAKGTQGFSAFEAVALVAQGKPPPFEISFASEEVHDEERYKRLAKLAADLERTYRMVGTGPPLRLIDREEFSFRWQGEVLETAESLRAGLDELRHAGQTLARELGLRADLELQAARRMRLKALAPRVESGALDLSSVPDMPADRLSALAETLTTDVRELTAASARTSAAYPLDAVRRMPLEQLDSGWREAQTKIWPASAFAKRKVRKLLQTYAETGVAEPDTDLRVLFKIRERDGAIRENPVATLAETGGGTDTNRSTEAVRQAIELRAALAALGSDVADSARFEAAASVLVAGSGEAVLQALQAYLAAEEVADARTHEFVRQDGLYPDGASVADFAAGLETVVAERARLQDWIKWTKLSKEGSAAGLGSFVKALEDGQIEEDAEYAFKRAYAAWWLPLAMDARAELRRFTRWEHEHIIETFRKLDEAAAELAPVEVLRRTAHGLPAKGGVPKKSELGTLRHQLSLERPSLPIRQLLAGLPETFGKLAPCVLMSPLSVAQYLPTGQASFDVIIFDEASQITPWDAIGAIARGRQTIIVGDPKQLPPTNFFGRANDDDEDLPEVERDLLSILDEVEAAGVPRHNLNWHYRSRDEALIAFSNNRYYRDRLVTFPAPSAGFDAIRFHKVNGIYARGQGRVNQGEAQAVAEMVKRRLTSWLAVPEDERQTLGVLTFNADQQALILELLDEIRRDNGALEWFFADEREEPVIVKNLESIQGDERDVMMFSVTFGPDLDGKLTMNFGPINGTGGEKRLNVAITRARRELHVFSSIRAEQINLERTRAVGVRDLKAFLDYAERGPIALPASDEGSFGPAENSFEEVVADALRAKGWEVRTQIGVSGFRVDLGIVHPDYAGSYLAGIECDGASYRSSATARDRDKIRQAVLEGLGWTILRVWSTDWFRSPSQVAARVHLELARRLEEDRQVRAADEVKADEQTTEVGLTEDLGDNAERILNAPSEPEQDGQPADEEVAGAEPEIRGADSGPPMAAAPISQFGRDVSLSSTPGGEAESMGQADDGFDTDRFFDLDYAPVLRRLIRRIVDREGPITLPRLARRVAQEHGWHRTGRRIQAHVQKNLGSVARHREFGAVFVWAPGSHADRVPFRGLNGRPIREISRTEIGSVLDAHAPDLANEEDPILALSRLLGIQRLSKDARAYLSDCVQWREKHRAGNPC